MPHYILRDKKVVVESDLLAWSKWFKTANRRVARDEIGFQEIITSFLGIDYQFGQGPPLLFETMVFPDCEICVRYATWDEAVAGHKRVVDDVRSEVSP